MDGSAPDDINQNGGLWQCVGVDGDDEDESDGLGDVIRSLSADCLWKITAAAWRRLVELRGPLSC